jgi:hypothetical protein
MKPTAPESRSILEQAGFKAVPGRWREVWTQAVGEANQEVLGVMPLLALGFDGYTYAISGAKGYSIGEPDEPCAIQISKKNGGSISTTAPSLADGLRIIHEGKLWAAPMSESFDVAFADVDARRIEPVIEAMAAKRVQARNMLAEAGYEDYSTGGGLMASAATALKLHSGSSVADKLTTDATGSLLYLITDGDGSDIPQEPDAPCLLSVNDEDGGFVQSEAPTLADAIRVIAEGKLLLHPQGDQHTVAFADIDAGRLEESIRAGTAKGLKA